MNHRKQLALHALGLVVLAFLGYFKVLTPEACASILVGLVVPSPAVALHGLVTKRSEEAPVAVDGDSK